MRHKTKLLDGTVILMVTLLALFYAYEVDVFANAPGEPVHERTLELDEVLAISALVCLGMTIFAVRRLLEARRETARRMDAEREARNLALHDVLTGLPNRRQFDEALAAACASPPRAGASHAVLMLDLNGFKRVNDVFGHPVGDEVLIHVSTRLSRAVRSGDLLARLGGDEFAILATHIGGPESATGLALRVIESLKRPVTAGGREHVIGSAIGVALTPQDGSDPAELVRKADIALYRAKDQGVSAMRFFEEEMDAHVRERDLIERELRAAIEAHAITPFYQPLVDLGSGRIRGFEALARWTHETLGEIKPERFIPVAEDAGLIGLLTDSLLTTACVQAVQWPAEVDLAFNVSPVLLRDPTFGLRLLATLGKSGLPPHRLELEITESALVRDLEAAQAALGALRQAGVRIALDDFGTGYSSLYHLRNFKLDRIKIDRSFVAAMTEDKDSAAIVKALVGLGVGLGLEVTAEGVETGAQRDLLTAQGCNQAQGFLYSEAVSGPEALKLIQGPKAYRKKA